MAKVIQAADRFKAPLAKTTHSIDLRPVGVTQGQLLREEARQLIAEAEVWEASGTFDHAEGAPFWTARAYTHQTRARHLRTLVEREEALAGAAEELALRRSAPPLEGA